MGLHLLTVCQVNHGLSAIALMRKHLLLVTCIFLSIGVIDLLTCIWYVGFTERRLSDRYSGKADCAIVLSGDFSGKGRIGDETRRRCSHALHLYNEKRVRKIICSGGYRPWRKETTAEQAVRWLKAHYIPENALFAENRSCSTIHNLQNSFTIAKDL
ncbi:MAG: YdcF family protein, partial [Thermoplasmatales archaeon]|nr:YdcF family protein [Thermoplasmatales archaeon]